MGKPMMRNRRMDVISYIFIAGLCAAVYGVITGKIALGIVFIISLVETLYFLLMPFRRRYLTSLGALLFIGSLLLLAYCICVLFLNIDVKTILRM